MATPIYHMTSLANLPSILLLGGLFCDRRIAQLPNGPVSIGHPHIKERRLRTAVPCGAGQSVGDYVPFYFAPRSPMLYAIHGGKVAGYTGGQSAVLYLVASTEAISGRPLPCVFTDGHPTMVMTDFFDDLTLIPTRVDWQVMRGRYWNDTDADPDRMRRRQAEFLVHDFLPWDLIAEIGCFSSRVEADLSAILASVPATARPPVNVRREWYF